MILPSWRLRLHEYMAGILRKMGHKPLQINSEPDHLHALFGMSPEQSISDLMRILKGDASEWVNKNRISQEKFYWQSGYGFFGLSKSRMHDMASYIENQHIIHRSISFLDEYKGIPDAERIPYDERYIFHAPI